MSHLQEFPLLSELLPKPKKLSSFSICSMKNHFYYGQCQYLAAPQHHQIKIDQGRLPLVGMRPIQYFYIAFFQLLTLLKLRWLFIVHKIPFLETKLDRIFVSHALTASCTFFNFLSSPQIRQSWLEKH